MKLIPLFLAFLIPFGFAGDNDKITQIKMLTAQKVINQLHITVNTYETDWGKLPPSGDGLNDTALVIYLDGDKSNGGPDYKYFEFPKEKVKGNQFLDPWGRPYYYREFASKKLTTQVKTSDPKTEIIFFTAFQIYSMGPDPENLNTWIVNYREIAIPKDFALDEETAHLKVEEQLEKIRNGITFYKLDYGRSIFLPKNVTEIYEEKIIEDKSVFLFHEFDKPENDKFRCDFPYLVNRDLQMKLSNFELGKAILVYCPYLQDKVVYTTLTSTMTTSKEKFEVLYQKQKEKLEELGYIVDYKKGIIGKKSEKE